MEDEPFSTRTRAFSGLTKVLGVVSLFFVTYALSVGPVARFYGKNNPASKAIESLYRPLEYLYDHVDVVRDFYDWYFKLWGIK